MALTGTAIVAARRIGRRLCCIHRILAKPHVAAPQGRRRPGLGKHRIEDFAELLRVRVLERYNFRYLGHLFLIELLDQGLNHVVSLGNFAYHNDFLGTRHTFEGQLPVERPDYLLLVNQLAGKHTAKYAHSPAAAGTAALAEN